MGRGPNEESNTLLLIQILGHIQEFKNDSQTLQDRPFFNIFVFQKKYTNLQNIQAYIYPMIDYQGTIVQ